MRFCSSTVLLLLFGLMSGCVSEKPVNMNYIMDFQTGNRTVVNKIEKKSSKIPSASGQSSFYRLLAENGLKEKADGFFKDAPVYSCLFCFVDEDGNTGWGFSREDTLECAAAAALSLPDEEVRKNLAQRAADLWQTGSDREILLFYDEVLRMKSPSCCLLFEQEGENPLCPKAVREGYKRVSPETGDTEFVRHGLQREFAENGILVKEYYCVNGECVGNVLVFDPVTGLFPAQEEE